MILSIDLNPVMKRSYKLDKFNYGTENIANSTSYEPGGEGIELAYLLNSFNEDVLVTGFLGGINGSYIHENLKEKGIIHDFLPIKDNSGSKISIGTVDLFGTKGQVLCPTIIVDNGPRVTREEVGGFYELYSNLLRNSRIVCGLGSLPMAVPKDIYFDLISMANKSYSRFFLAINGEELKYALEASPYMVVLSKEELEDLIKLKLDYRSEIIRGGKFILEKGVKLLVIDLGKKGSLVLTEEKVYSVEFVDLDKDEIEINYGHLMAGYAISLKRNYDYEMTLKLGQACGMVKSLYDEDIIDMSNIKKIMNHIEITSFNY